MRWFRRWYWKYRLHERFLRKIRKQFCIIFVRKCKFSRISRNNGDSYSASVNYASRVKTNKHSVRHQLMRADNAEQEIERPISCVWNWKVSIFRRLNFNSAAYSSKTEENKFYLLSWIALSADLAVKKSLHGE